MVSPLTRAGLLAAGGMTVATGGLALAGLASQSVASASALALGMLGVGVAVGTGVTKLTEDHANFVPQSSVPADFLEIADIVTGRLSRDRSGHFLRDRSGHFWAVMRLAGVNYSTASTSEIESILAARARSIGGIVRAGLDFTIMTVREPVTVALDADYDCAVLSTLHDTWQHNFEKSHRNAHYLIFRKKKGPSALKDFCERLAELEDSLAKYKPTFLSDVADTSDETNGTAVSPLRSFLSTLISGHAVQALTSDPFEQLGLADVGFDVKTGRIVYVSEGRRSVAALLRIRDWSENDHSALVDTVLRLDTRVEFFLQAEPVAPGTAVAKMTIERNLRRFGSVGLAQEFADALDAAQDGTETSVWGQGYFLIYAHDEQRLDQYLTYVSAYARELGHTPVVETKYVQGVWRSRLPGSWRLSRLRRLTDANLASLVNWATEPAGLDRCDWGPGPLRYFTTAGGGAYALNVHVHDRTQAAANSITFGGVDSGKTTLWQFLLGGALRHEDLRVVAFDSRQGMRVFFEAVRGARYLNAGNMNDVAFNPLAHMDGDADVQFLNQFVRLLAGYDTASDTPSEETISAQTEIAHMLRAAKNIDPAKRSLRSTWNSGFETGSKIRQRLARWVSDDGIGRIFNAPKDSLDLAAHRLVGFAMDDLMLDPVVAGAVVAYIAHRVKRIGRGASVPHLVYVDEAATFLEHGGFRQMVAEWFRQMRKDRGGAHLVFQDPGALLRFPEFAGNAATNVGCRFAFLNPRANEDEYRAVGFSDADIRIVRGQSHVTGHLKRWVLVKRGDESVVLDVDLSRLGGHLRLLRGGAEPVELMHQMQAQFGISGWVQEYVKWQ